MSKEYNREMIDELYRNELKYRRFIEYLESQLDEEIERYVEDHPWIKEEEIAKLKYTGFEIHGEVDEKLKGEIIEALEKMKEEK